MINKLKAWVTVFLPTILGIAEAVLKLLKETLTLIADILFPVIPIEKFKQVVNSLRALINKAYEWLSNAKDAVLKKIGLL